jgi:hypothetical protein
VRVLVTTAQFVEARAERARALERLTYLGHLVESAVEGIRRILAGWKFLA